MTSMQRWKNTLYLQIPPLKKDSNQKRDRKHQKYRNFTKLAKYVWELKHKNIVPAQQANGKYSIKFIAIFNKTCLTEKLRVINFIHDNSYLNKKSEWINKCWHIKNANYFYYRTPRDEIDCRSTFSCMNVWCFWKLVLMRHCFV